MSDPPKEYLTAYVVRLRDVETGEERTTGVHEFEFSHYWWAEGNMSCACNRQAEWHRADPSFPEGWTLDDDHSKCRHPELGSLFGECDETRYQALYATVADGTVVLID